MTHQEKLRSSLRFLIMRSVWVNAGKISRWAGKQIIKRSHVADRMDSTNKGEESPVLGEESPAQDTKEICHTAPNSASAK